MARRTKLGDLDMRFKSSHRIVARRNIFGCLGSVLSVPYYIDLETDYIVLDPDTNCGCDGLHADPQFCDMVL